MSLSYSISLDGLRFIEAFEGFSASIYVDVTGTPTIGYGTTVAAGVVNPLPDTCTEAEAERWLDEYIQRSVVPALVAACVAGGREFDQDAVDACCSLGYNLGAGIFGNGHTIGYYIRHHQYTHAEIGNAFLLYEYAGNEKLVGLITRREAERALFDRGQKR